MHETTGINLIPAYRLLASERRLRIRRWATVGILYTTVLVAVCVVLTVVFDQTAENLADELTFIQNKAHIKQRRLSQLRPKLEEIKLKLAASRAVTTQPDWSVVLVLLANNQGDNIVLGRCRIEPLERRADSDAPESTPRVAQELRYRLLFAGFGKSQSDVSQFVLRLEQLGLNGDMNDAKPGDPGAGLKPAAAASEISSVDASSRSSIYLSDSKPDRVPLFKRVTLIKTNREVVQTDQVVTFNVSCVLGGRVRVGQ